MKLYNEDCVKMIDRVGFDNVDLIVTSPPYDDLRTYQGTLNWNFDKFMLVASKIEAVLAPGGILVWIVNDKTHKGTESGSSFKQALYFKENLGLNLHDTMIWKKDSCAFPEQTRYYPIFEYMFVFTKGKIKTFNPIKDRKNKWFGRKKIQGPEYNKRGSRVTRRNKRVYTMSEFGTRHNIWSVPTGYGKSTKDKIDHPAIFPEQLIADHIFSWSNENDLVMDPFMGSGTTGKMAKLLNRKFVGFEINSEYYEMAQKRISSVSQ